MLNIKQGEGGAKMKNNHYPIPRVFCGAKTRSGGSCRQPAMPNGRCRLHGGKSLSGPAHGRYVHGFRTKGAIAERQRFANILKEARSVLKQIKS